MLLRSPAVAAIVTLLRRITRCRFRFYEGPIVEIPPKVQVFRYAIRRGNRPTAIGFFICTCYRACTVFPSLLENITVRSAFGATDYAVLQSTHVGVENIMLRDTSIFVLFVNSCAFYIRRLLLQLTDGIVSWPGAVLQRRQRLKIHIL